MRAIALIACCGVLAACAYNETLGRNQLLLVDDSSMAGAAEQAWRQVQAATPPSRDAAATARVRSVAGRIIDAAGLGGAQWQIVLFEDPQVNAFVLPGNRMGVNTGLLRLAQNDDQLAAVLGHEVAHVVARHAAERASQTAAASIALAGAQGIAGDTQIAEAISSYGGAGAQLGVLLPFSRRHELEADRLGVDYMRAAGFNPREAVTLWRRMAQQGGSGTPEFISTHPSDGSRIQALEAYIAQRGY